MTPLEILTEARRILTPPGAWRQGGSIFGADSDGKCCANAALYVAQGGLEADRTEARLAARALLLAVVRTDALVTWNDEPDRTQEEVLAVFDRAIGAVS